MRFQELVYNAICSEEALTDTLATFREKPAVFYIAAPSDKATGWSKTQYPRIDYTMDNQANPERGTDGNLIINLWCDDSGPFPEDIEPIIKEILDGLLIQPDDSAAQAFKWQGTAGFDAGDLAAGVTGATLVFDVYGLPRYETTEPDPILGIWDFLKRIHPGAMIIADKRMEAPAKPTDEVPFFYVRIEGLALNRATAWIIWYDLDARIHVFTKTKEAELRICRMIQDQMNSAGQIALNDGSPLQVREVNLSTHADQLVEGQLGLKGEYGVLVQHSADPPINEINVNIEEG